jgi:hypothetical protein
MGVLGKNGVGDRQGPDPGGTCQHCCMLRRKHVGIIGGVVFEYPAGGNGAKPFAHIPLGQTGPCGELLAGREALSSGHEQPCAMPDVDHRAEHGVSKDRHHALAEGFHSAGVECGFGNSGSHVLFSAGLIST